MAEKNVNEIPRDVRELFQKGTMALQRQNFDYAIAIFNQVLQREPAFFDCRQALRAAQFKKTGGSTSFFKKMLGGASSSPLIAKGQLALRKDPLEAMNIAEQVLNGDPNSSIAHRLLAEAALAAGLPRTAIFEYEILRKQSPKDVDLARAHADALASAGDVAKAEAIYTELLRADPTNADLATALKDLSAKKTLVEGGYDALADGKGSYRDILKDKDEAVALEQEKREVKTDDVSQRLIKEYEARLPKEPNNLKLMRSLAELYMQKKDFDRALQYTEQMRRQESGADPSLEKLVADIHLRKFDHAIAQLDPSDPAQAEQIAKLQADKAAYQLEECRSRVDRYPTDLGLRFELGELLFKAGKITEAIGEFQKAQANPHRRLQALGCLAQCFAKRGMNDSAVRMLQSAIKEKIVFDEEKKDLLYQLGCILEKMGKTEEAIEQFKVIYESDIGFRDVAAKVDAYYAQQGGG
jgi:tetratricopeptide (TPR) repeat protein